MAYLGKTPSQAVRSRYYYTATGGETSLSGADDNSNVLTFTDGNYVDVSLNGATLVAGSDYNTTTANTIGGLAALTASDIVEVLVYDTFSVFGGNMAANLNFKDNVKANFGTGNDLVIYHDGSNSILDDVGTGNLQLQISGSPKLEITTSGIDVTGYIDYGPSSGNIGKIGFDSNNVYIGSTSGTGSIHFRNNIGSTDAPHSSGDDKMVITDSGVGIGTSSPTFAAGGGLNVVNGTFATIRARGGSSTGIDFAQDSSSNGYLYNRDNASIIFGTNNAERMRITSSGFVGIGESAPQKMLHITRNDSDGIIVLDANGTTTDHQICFSKDYGTGGTTGGNYWGIGVDGSENKLVFAYDPNAQASLSADAKVVIDSSGNVGIGTTSIPTGKLAVEGGIYLSGSSNFLRFGADSSTTTGVAIHRPAANTIAFVTNGNERARVTDNGITFNGDTAAANALDDYEFGTWTPSVGGTATYAAANYGRYTKIGNIVSLNFTLGINAIGTGSTASIINLPFASENIGEVQTGCISYYGSLTVAVNFFAFYIHNNATTTGFVGNTGNNITIALNGFAPIGNSTTIYCSITYRAA